MRYIGATILTLALAVCVDTGWAVGTRKKAARVVTVRREFVPLTQASPPQEYHNDSGTVHRLVCRGPGLERCGWKTPPEFANTAISLAEFDAQLANLLPMCLGECSYSTGGLVARVKRLPNGFEYTVTPGSLTAMGLDSTGSRPRTASGSNVTIFHNGPYRR